MKKLEITIQDILWMLKKHVLWILLATVVFGAGSWAYTKYNVTPMYTTSISFCVFASARTAEGVTVNDLNADQRLANTYVNILTSNNVLQQVADSLDVPISAGAIRGMVTASLISNTQNIRVSITSSKPQLAADVGNAIADVAPAAIQEIVEAGSVSIIDRATVPSTPSSPNIQANTTTGLVLGFLLSCIVVVLLAVFDTTVWREEDLVRTFDLPVLGYVPNIPCSVELHQSRKE